jgi:hypothetical protein
MLDPKCWLYLVFIRVSGGRRRKWDGDADSVWRELRSAKILVRLTTCYYVVQEMEAHAVA